MAKKNLSLSSLFVVVLLAIVAGGCDILKSPTAPSGGGYDPGRPIDAGNRPPGPGPTVKATFHFGVFGGDCSSSPVSCAGEIAPTEDPSLAMFVGDGKGGQIPVDKVYVVKKQTVYTLALCTNHPGVPGRKINMVVQVGRNSVPLLFNEDDPSKIGTVCIAANLVNGASSVGSSFGEVIFSEGGQDLIDEAEETIENILLGFRL